jgi:hypothetical protein
MKLRSLAVVALPFVVACGASIDPAMQASIDGQVASLKTRGTAYPAPTTKVPMPLATGQWTKVKLVDKDGKPSIFTYKIVGQEGDAFWFEIVMDRYTGRTIIKELVSVGDRMDPSQIEIRHVILKDRGHAPIDYQQPLLSIVQGTYKKIAEAIVVRWEGLPQETETVPAGTFTDAFKADSEVSLYGYTSRAKVWSHTAVPIQGLVHSESEDGTKIDLIDFGTTGASSEL